MIQPYRLKHCEDKLTCSSITKISWITQLLTIFSCMISVAYRGNILLDLLQILLWHIYHSSIATARTVLITRLGYNYYCSSSVLVSFATFHKKKQLSGAHQQLYITLPHPGYLTILENPVKPYKLMVSVWISARVACSVAYLSTRALRISPVMGSSLTASWASIHLAPSHGLNFVSGCLVGSSTQARFCPHGEHIACRS